MSSLGDRLRELRIEKHLTKEKTAKELFVSPSTIARWEKGEKVPSVEELERIRRFYGLENRDTLLSLISFEEDTKTSEEDTKNEEETAALTTITEDLARISNNVQTAGSETESQEIRNLDRELRFQIRIRWVLITIFVILALLIWILYKVERYYNSYEYLEGRPMEEREEGR